MAVAVRIRAFRYVTPCRFTLERQALRFLAVGKFHQTTRRRITEDGRLFIGIRFCEVWAAIAQSV
jgi:hypothetical protein